MNINLIVGIVKTFVQRIVCSIFGAKDINQVWSSAETYEAKTIVIYENKDENISQAYIALQDVPAGIEIANTIYWQSTLEYFNSGSGGGSKTYIAEPGRLISNFTISHNLNGYPVCTFIDITPDSTTNEPLNEEIIGEVTYINENQVRVELAKSILVRCILRV